MCDPQRGVIDTKRFKVQDWKMDEGESWYVVVYDRSLATYYTFGPEGVRQHSDARAKARRRKRAVVEPEQTSIPGADNFRMEA